MRPAGNSELARYLNKSRMTIHRWKRDAKLKTPDSMVVNDREINDLDEWDAWLRSTAVSRVEHSAEPSGRAQRLKEGKERAATKRRDMA